MPGFDGSGPFGDGRPGRGLGPCGRFEGAGYGAGYGGGRGRFGFRNRRRFYDAPVNYTYREPVYAYSKEDMLAQKEELQRQLQWLNEQLAKEESQ
jgi:hypothetical protein